jgi:hypothetical protein
MQQGNQEGHVMTATEASGFRFHEGAQEQGWVMD